MHWNLDAAEPPVSVRMRRRDLVQAAEMFVCVIDGTPIKFTAEEATRLAFAYWRRNGDPSPAPRGEPDAR
jgi:hypothetical protein